MTKPAGFSVLTACATIEDFIEAFRNRCTRDSIFVPHVDARLFGEECSFAILLANHHVALAGTCVVEDVFTNANNPYAHAGMWLGIRRMGPDSQRVFLALEAARELADEPDTLVKPPRVTAHGTQRVPQLVLDGGSSPRAEAPTPSSPFLVPASPVSPEPALDCRLYDSTVDESYDDEPDTLVKRRR